MIGVNAGWGAHNPPSVSLLEFLSSGPGPVLATKDYRRQEVVLRSDIDLAQEDLRVGQREVSKESPTKQGVD